MGNGPGERRRSTDLGLTRRQTLAGIGGLGALGIGGIAATSQDGPSVNLDGLRWTAQRRRKFAQPFEYFYDPDDDELPTSTLLYDEPLYSIDEVSSLSYLGVRWDEYGNPEGDGEMEGAWQHTFLLSNFGMAQQMRDEHHTADSGERTITKNYPISYGPHDHYVSVPTLSVRATGDGDEDDPIDTVSISPLRDEDRFGIVNPGTFENDFGEDPDGAEDFRAFADGVVKNRNEYQPNVGSLRYAMAIEEDAEQDAAALVSLGKTFLSMSKYLEAPIAVLDGVYDIYQGIAELTDEPEQPDQDHVNFFEGFRQSYPGDDFYAGPYCGEFVTFHVYVAPGEGGEIEVESRMDHEDPRSTGYRPTFSATTRWTVEFDALEAPSGDSHSPVDKYNARITSHTDEKEAADGGTIPDETDIPAMQEYDRSKAPNATITPDPSNPQTISDGTELSFDAYETTVVDGNVEDYTWYVRYTSEPDQHADEYVDVIAEETYDGGNLPELDFTVDVPDDPAYTDVHMVELEVTTYDEEHDEQRTGRDRYLFSTTDIGEPEFSLDQAGEPVEGGDLELSASVSSTPTSVAAIDWEVTEYGFDRPSTAPNVTGSGEAFTYTPPAPGFYRIEATVTDTLGPENTKSIGVTVEELDAAAEITLPALDSVKAGESHDFRVDYSGIPNVATDAITWEFGDLETQTGEFATYAFPESAGGDTVTVSVTVPSESHDVDVTATRDYEVTIDDDMTVTLDGPDSLVVGNTGRVEATASNYESDTVTYGFENTDGLAVADPHQRYRNVTYDSPGTETVSVTAIEDGDNDERAEDSIDIDVRPFTVDLEGPSSTKEDEYVSFDAVTEGDDADLRYEWTAYDASGSELGDVFGSSDASAGGEFPDPGQKTVEVVASDGDWSDSATAELEVAEDSDMTVSLDGPDSLYVGETGRVEATASGYETDTVTYGFENTDGLEVADPHQDYRNVTYDEAGTQTVSVTAIEDGDNDERAEDSITIDVEHRPFSVEITDGDDSVKSDTSETYEASVTNAASSVSYDWNVGSESGDSTDVSFGGCGTQTVRVTAEENNGPERSDSASVDVDVYDCDMDVSLSGPDQLEVGETGTVNASVSGAEATVNYGFSNVDSVNSGARDDPYRDVTYHSSGTETVEVEAYETGDNNERAEASHTIEVVDPPDPEVSIGTPQTPSACSGSYTVSASVSNTDGSVSYDWYLDGSSIGSGQEVSFSVSTTGSKTLHVEIEDSSGATASDTKDFSACAGTGGY